MELINTITLHQWLLIGGLVASIPGTIGIVEWVKRHHYKVKAEELWSGFVILNVTVWGFVLTAVDALSANLGQITHIGTLIPQIAPYVYVWGPRVSIAALLTHSIASALYAWWIDRKSHKPLTNLNLPDFQTQMQQLNGPTVSGQPSSSLGVTASGNRQNVIQL